MPELRNYTLPKQNSKQSPCYLLTTALPFQLPLLRPNGYVVTSYSHPSQPKASGPKRISIAGRVGTIGCPAGWELGMMWESYRRVYPYPKEFIPGGNYSSTSYSHRGGSRDRRGYSCPNPFRVHMHLWMRESNPLRFCPQIRIYAWGTSPLGKNGSMDPYLPFHYRYNKPLAVPVIP
ncbi:hypothetical protein SUGI_1481500 [Cryptomeria japonica]|uniref:Uncharacterized protein n=1 Tax=Cryptomeria japonica TaxID=3369 RepID=A0AAD3RR48_CRYJA|nr:hypothetical protein SUGI_1479490 [Cryptomeria japonica]GLJ58871.1 hypothetical protein SUGI_1481500 [Cryptomeria japonica]